MVNQFLLMTLNYLVTVPALTPIRFANVPASSGDLFNSLGLSSQVQQFAGENFQWGIPTQAFSRPVVEKPDSMINIGL